MDGKIYGTVDDIEKSYEWDYLCFGQRGDKCFLRVYLKTKEVVEMGLKGWFLKLWQLQGLISRYDLYVLEKAYENGAGITVTLPASSLPWRMIILCPMRTAA